ncbi:MAG: hypothetical protein FJ313_01520 [Gemmatimonadetes bacterium]|nr:hypothetical protein [Gemmatimonadota bacterium]
MTRTGLLAWLMVVLPILSQAPSGAQPPEQPWGAGNGKFCTRLTSDKRVYAIDEPIKLTLEVRNESDATQPFASPDLIGEDSLLVRRDGDPARYIAGDFQTCTAIEPLKPGETRRAQEPRLNAYWDFRQPGRYTIQFPETGLTTMFFGPFTEADIRAMRRVLPASNVLEIEVTAPPDGKVPPLDLTQHVRLFTRPAGFEVARWRGVATNVDWPELGEQPEDMGAVFAFARPEAPWPAYENQEVHVFLRLPEGRAADELKVELAELDGSALRLQLRLKRVSGGGRVLPCARLGLDRRLPPGDYTCDVRLVTELRGAAKPEVDGYRFGFTVLAQRAVP